MPPTVSIIIHTLNEEKLIAASLAALRRLDGEREVILFDGGGRVRTREIAVRLT